MQIAKYLINIIGSSILAWFELISLTLWVTPPIGKTKEESFEFLKQGLIRICYEDLPIFFLAVLILILITWGIQKLFERKENRKELLYLFAMNCIIIMIGFALGIYYTYNALGMEIENHF